MGSIIRKLTEGVFATGYTKNPTEIAVQTLGTVAEGVGIGILASKHKGGLDAGKVPLDGAVGLGLSAVGAFVKGPMGTLAHHFGRDLLLISSFRKGEEMGHGGKGGKAKAALAQAAAAGTPVPTATAAAVTAANTPPGTPVAAAGEVESGIAEAIEEGGLMAGDPLVEAARHL